MERTKTELNPKSHDPFNLLLDEIEFQANFWAENDKEPEMAALCRAMADQPDDSPFAKLLEATAFDRFERRNPRNISSHNGLERRRPEPASDTTRFEPKSISELVGVIRASVCNYAMRTSSGKFTYEGYDKPEAWQDILDDAGKAHLDPFRNDRAATQLFINLRGQVQTNIAERYTPLEIIMQAHRERFDQGIDWLDVGTGIMEGPRQLLLKDNEKYPISLEIARTGRGDDIEDLSLTQKTNQLLRLPSLLKHCVAVDLRRPNTPSSNMYDPGIIEWCEASLRPSEYMNQPFMMRYRSLLEEEVPDLDFQVLNLADAESVSRFRTESSIANFDIISFITVLHQVSRDDMKKMFEQAREMLNQDGLIVVQDFAYFNPDPKGEPAPIESMRMYSEWFKEPGRYRTYVYDSALNNPGLQEVLRSTDSRCRELLLSKGSLAINGHKPLVEIIENA